MSQSVNFGLTNGEFVWRIPGQLPLESRVEIRDTDDLDAPYELRFTHVQEPSEAQKKVASLFVTVELINYSKQGFEAILGDKQCGWVRFLYPEAEEGAFENAEVDRGYVSQIIFTKDDDLKKLQPRRQPQSEGTWAKIQECIVAFFSWIISCFSALMQPIARLFRA